MRTKATDSDRTIQLRHGLSLVFTDADGTRYYRDTHGCITDKRGELVSLQAERAVRAQLLAMAQEAAREAAADLMKALHHGGGAS